MNYVVHVSIEHKFELVVKFCDAFIFFFCRVGSAVVFRDLDADDFHHPLDKQVHPIWRLFIASL